MTPLTVACLFVKGEYPYTEEYVHRLKRMVDRWCDQPFTFVCLTDRSWLFSGTDIKVIPIQKIQDCFAYWTKIELFNPIRQWTGRVLYLDLDTLIVAPLAPILSVISTFALTADPHQVGMRTTDRYGRKIVRRFNSSVMLWDGGTQTELFTDWTLDVAKRLSGDQDWYAERCPEAFGMPRAWFPRLSEVGRPPFQSDVKIILSKYPKNHVAAREHDWFEPLWGAA